MINLRSARYCSERGKPARDARRASLPAPRAPDSPSSSAPIAELRRRLRAGMASDWIPLGRRIDRLRDRRLGGGAASARAGDRGLGRQGRAPRRRPSGDRLSAGTAGLRSARPDRRGDSRASGRHRLRRDRIRQDHADAEDLPRAGARHARPDRPHAAAAHRRAQRRRADRRGARTPSSAPRSATRCASPTTRGPTPTSS